MSRSRLASYETVCTSFIILRLILPGRILPSRLAGSREMACFLMSYFGQ